MSIRELELSMEGRVEVSGEELRLFAPGYRVSDRAMREIEAIERRQLRALATAHLYVLD